MGSRLDLHEELCQVLGSRYVYFQPPENFKMVYPAIVYHKNRMRDRYANGKSYVRDHGYTVTLIEKDADSDIGDRLKDMKYCSFDRSYVADNLYHTVFTLYY